MALLEWMKNRALSNEITLMNHQVRIEQRGVKLWLGIWALVGSIAVAAERPPAEKGYYEKRISIVGYPVPTAALETATAVSDTKAVLRALQMTGVSYAGMPPAHAEEAAKTLRAQGFNAVIGGGHRYLFSDTPNEKLATNVVCGGTYEQLLRDAKTMSEACRRQGLKFFLHQTSTMVDASLIARHPTWAAVDLATGKPYQNSYGTAGVAQHQRPDLPLELVARQDVRSSCRSGSRVRPRRRHARGHESHVAQ